jgi:hypothetical protein
MEKYLSATEAKKFGRGRGLGLGLAYGVWVPLYDSTMCRIKCRLLDGLLSFGRLGACGWGWLRRIDLLVLPCLRWMYVRHNRCCSLPSWSTR